AELLRLSLEPDRRREVAGMIDGWIDRISRATDPGDLPPATRLIEAGGTCEIHEGQAFAPRGEVLWVRSGPSGEGLRFCGKVAVPTCPYGSRFPLSPHAWLTAAVVGPVQAWDTETLMEDGDPWVGLTRFHAVILDAIERARVRERALRHARLESSVLHDEAQVEAAVSGLARPARPDAPGPVARTGGQVMREACRAVGEALGLEVKAPPIDLEATDDPLWFIARASGFRTRRVALGPNWWASDGGPLLGSLADGGRPVALVPSPG